jgi:hypothetical protein
MKINTPENNPYVKWIVNQIDEEDQGKFLKRIENRSPIKKFDCNSFCAEFRIAKVSDEQAREFETQMSSSVKPQVLSSDEEKASKKNWLSPVLKHEDIKREAGEIWAYGVSPSNRIDNLQNPKLQIGSRPMTKNNSPNNRLAGYDGSLVRKKQVSVSPCEKYIEDRLREYEPTGRAMGSKEQFEGSKKYNEIKSNKENQITPDNIVDVCKEIGIRAPGPQEVAQLRQAHAQAQNRSNSGRVL